MTNEQAKLKAIQEAYGEYYEKAKPDKNGWASISRMLPMLFDGWVDPGGSKNNHTWRPKSLRGIEDNNGWIRIESVDDLPKEAGKYEFVFNHSSKRFRDSWNLNPTPGAKASALIRFSHWRKIEEVPGPIY